MSLLGQTHEYCNKYARFKVQYLPYLSVREHSAKLKFNVATMHAKFCIPCKILLGYQIYGNFRIICFRIICFASNYCNFIPLKFSIKTAAELDYSQSGICVLPYNLCCWNKFCNAKLIEHLPLILLKFYNHSCGYILDVDIIIDHQESTILRKVLVKS